MSKVQPSILFVDGYHIPKDLIFGNPNWPEPPPEPMGRAEQNGDQWDTWILRVREFCAKNGIEKRIV
jgi:hypothetical protein